MHPVPAFRALRSPDSPAVANHPPALATDLAASFGVNLGKVHPTLPANPLQKAENLSPGSLDAILGQHPPCPALGLEVFHKDLPQRKDREGLPSVSTPMGPLEMKLLATIGNALLHPGNLQWCSLPVARPLLFSRPPGLQPSQLALQGFEALGPFPKAPSEVVRNCSKTRSIPVVRP